MLKIQHLLVIALVLFGVAIASARVRAPRPAKTDVYDWEKPKDRNKFINGVYPACRQYWINHAQQRQFAVQNTTCPFGPFASDIVDHTIESPDNVHIDGYDCGKFIEGNSGERGANKNPILHAEVEAIERLMDCTLHPEFCDANGNQLRAQDKFFWGNLTQYTTGESCVMDAAATAWAGIGEVVYSISVDFQKNSGWNNFVLDSQDIFKLSITPTRPHTLIKNVDADLWAVHYSWQYIATNPCPTGCARTPTNFCLKTSA